MDPLFEGHGAELIGGELRAMSPAGVAHQKAAQVVFSALDKRFGDGGARKWEFLTDVFVVFVPGAHEYAPDLSGWRVERFKLPAKGQKMLVTPDWACDILSESNRAQDMATRREIFGKNGVRHHWIIDPSTVSIFAYEWRLDDWEEIKRVDGVTGRVSLAPFEDVALELGDVFKFV